VRIRAVTFDVGGTLIEAYPSVGAVYAAVAREHGLSCCAEKLGRRFAECWAARPGFGYTRAEWFQVVRQSFEGQAEVDEVFFGRIYDRFTEAGAWRLFEDVLPTLGRLRENGVRTAVISNWDDRLEPLLENLGIKSYFEHLTVSGKVGHHKPAPEVFRHALDALKLEPEEALHVGDSQREDVEGARAAGMEALRIRRKGAERLGDITSLGEILGALIRNAHRPVD
jgi:putative hydrolase of the HAD superfamily